MNSPVSLGDTEGLALDEGEREGEEDTDEEGERLILKEILAEMLEEGLLDTLGELLGLGTKYPPYKAVPSITGLSPYSQGISGIIHSDIIFS